MKVLLLTPPTVQLNTPYPATPYLAGMLLRRGFEVAQADAGLELCWRLFASAGLRRLRPLVESAGEQVKSHPSVAHFLAHAEEVVGLGDLALELLCNRDHSLVHRVAARRLFPEGPRFSELGPRGHEQEYLDWAFGHMGVVDRARTFATLFLEDLADVVQAACDPHFGFARYGESLSHSPPSIEPLLCELAQPPLLTTALLAEITLELLAREHPDVVGMTLPFPGTVIGALRMAKTIKERTPGTKIIWGGGWVNTELRDLREPRLFDYVDAVTYDDGEGPLLCLLDSYVNSASDAALLRTRVRVDGEVRLVSSEAARDVPFRERGGPTYAGLPLDRYLGLIDSPNPMHRLWSDTRWNKLVVAHGCYWHKCAFCDTSLDYIARYEQASACAVVDQMEALIRETGGRAFHFVDEAAPPAALQGIAEELLRRGLAVSWWGNIRFEKTFTPSLCRLLARSGCIALTGGLEVASNRLLALMDKGITIEQAARVTKAMSDAGIRVHAYLMYGFPSETAQETVDSLEVVRQLFSAGCLDSAYWHRFAATIHSPVGREPARFGIRLRDEPGPTFAHNDVAFEDSVGCDHDRLGEGLRRGLYNFMHGLGLEQDVRGWFEMRVPKPRVSPELVEKALASAT